MTTSSSCSWGLNAQLHEDDVVKVVVPVVGQGVLDWLANDEKAFSHSRRSPPTGWPDDLPGEPRSMRGAGEADVALAIRDALATFPADVIVVAVSREDVDLEDLLIALGLRLNGRGTSHSRGHSGRFVSVSSTCMTTSSNRETRAAENEDLFRRLNERLHTLATIASSSVLEADTPERFLCECSQTDCSRVLQLTPSEYRAVRETNRRFLAFPTPTTRSRTWRPWSKSVEASGSSRRTVRQAG